MAMWRRPNKFRNQKSEDGYDSKAESRRAGELWALHNAGAIKNLQEQVKFEIIPKQVDESGKMLERAAHYIADFVYNDEDGNRIIEDVKGFKTPEYILKRKLMLHVHGIRVQES